MDETNELTIAVKAVIVTKHAIGGEVTPPSGNWQLVSSQVLAVERKATDEPAPIELNRSQHNRRMRVWLAENPKKKMEDFVDPETGATTDPNGFGRLPDSAPRGNQDYLDETVYLTWSRS